MKISVMNSWIENIDIAKAYKDVIDGTFEEFSLLIDKTVKNEKIREKARNPINFLTKAKEGAILIKDENYKLKSNYFNILNIAMKRSIKKQARKYMTPLYKSKEYLQANSLRKTALESAFVNKFILKLHKQYMLLVQKRKMDSGEYGKKPHKINHASKYDYVRNSIEGTIIGLYMDAFYDLSGEQGPYTTEADI